jgi:hypothetical protein
MSIDCVDSGEAAEGSIDGFGPDDAFIEANTPLWYGRDVDLAIEKWLHKVMIAQFYAAAFREIAAIKQVQLGARRYDLLDMEEEGFEEIDIDFDQHVKPSFQLALHHPSNRTFALADLTQFQANIENCRNVFKSAARGVVKCTRAVGRGVKKGAKKVVHFVKEHKTGILIGAAVAAVAVGVYVCVGALGHAAAAAGAGATAIDRTSRKRREDEEDPSPDSPDIPSENPNLFASPIFPLSKPSADQNPHEKNAVINLFEHVQGGKKVFSADPLFNLHDQTHRTTPPNAISPLNSFLHTLQYGLETMKSSFSAPELHELQSHLDPLIKSASGAQTIAQFAPSLPTPLKSAHASFMESLKSLPQALGGLAFSLNGIPMQALGGLALSLNGIPTREPSRFYYTEGAIWDGMATTFTNGINNSYKEAVASAEYLRSLGSNQRIEGIYNHTNGPIVDLLEVFSLNYSGYSPKTQNLLMQKWSDFHNKNKDRPYAKCLHFCHSQGAIHTKNALMKLPKEVRDRVIVVAIAPAVVVSDKLCYQSYNYASKKDLVHYGEDVVAYFQTAFGPEDESRPLHLLESLSENKDELIVLEPHEGAEGIDHGILSPTYKNVVQKHIREYQLHNGEYR